MKKLVTPFIPVLDVLLSPIVLLAALLFKVVGRLGLRKMTFTKSIFHATGVYPIMDHYYEPMMNPKHLYKPLSQPRYLPGIHWNTEEQLSLLGQFHFQDELSAIPSGYTSDTRFHYNNGSFGTGDAEYLYSLIRCKQPKRIIEIGSGHSTKIARLALEKNAAHDAGYVCRHICIEPYEMPWLEKIGVEVIRKRAEHIDPVFYQQLESGDILFIDSSHMIRPQGDVLFEFLELLPTLHSGVIVHVHDIFSPRDYLDEWIIGENKFWNEQYLLEAFLTNNRDWEIIGAVNFLKHAHYDLLSSQLPMLTQEREPGSFYMVRK